MGHVRSLLYMGEVRIRSVRSMSGLVGTWGTRSLFPEELISPLAKPFLPLPWSSFLVLTQSTEAFPTYVATSPLACSYYVFPSLGHHCWSYWITSFFSWDRTKYHRFLLLCMYRYHFFLSLTPMWVVPLFWHLSYVVGAAQSTHSLLIQLQSKIYDHLMLTVAFWFIPSVCSLALTLFLICLATGLLVPLLLPHLTNHRLFGIGVPLLTAAIAQPPDCGIQIVASSPLSALVQLALSVASMVHFRSLVVVSRP